MDFISRDALIAAMNAWVLRKETFLGDLLQEQKALSAERGQLLNALVDEHVRQHGNDPRQSLESLSSASDLRSELKEKLIDTDLRHSLQVVGAAKTADPLQTRPLGEGTSAGTRFRILRPHAEGGLGKVAVARDEELHREVALKQLKPRHADDPGSRERFVVEAEITGGLEHPGIVPVYGLGQTGDGRPFYVMRFIRGDSLGEAITAFHSRFGNQSDPQGRDIALRKLLGRLIDVCNVMEYAHSRGVLHRDLKPDNIMLGKYGETLVVDWGLAKPLGQPCLTDADSNSAESPLVPASGNSGETLPGSTVGTPAYMSPEQAAGRLDQLGPASDIYCLGATLYHLLTGQPPVRDADLATVLRRVQRGDVPRPRQLQTWIPPALEAACLKAIALQPSDRYTSPGQFADELERWLADEPITAYSDSWRERLARWSRHHQAYAQAIGVALVIVAVVAIAAGIVINRALKREFLTEQRAEKRQQFEAGLKQETWNEEQLKRMENISSELNDLGESIDRDRRVQALYDRVADSVRRILEKRQLAEDDQHAAESTIELLRKRQAKDVEKLAMELQSRLRRWETVIEQQAPFGDTAVSAVFGFESVVTKSESGDALQVPQPPVDNLVRTKWPSTGNVRWDVTFSEKWGDATRVGLALQVTSDSRYLCVLTSEQDPTGHTSDSSDDVNVDDAALPKLQQILSLGGQLSLRLLRNEDLLMERLVSVSADKPLRMRLSREGLAIFVQINEQPPVPFIDLFGVNRTDGMFAVYWPTGLEVVQLRAEKQSLPLRPSPFELGDDLVAHGQYQQAFDAYSAVVVGQDSDQRQELDFKLGVCLAELERNDEAEKKFQAVAKQPGKQWPVMAACRYWLLQVLWKQDNPFAAEQVVNDLTRNHSFDELLPLVPTNFRRQLLSWYRQNDAYSRIAWAHDPVTRLKRASQIEELLNENPLQRIDTHWRKADAFRVTGNLTGAIQTLEELLKNDSLDYGERIGLLRDYTWVMCHAKEFDLPKTMLQRWLGKSPEQPDLDYAPLLVEMARIAVAQRQWAEADRQLEMFFDLAPRVMSKLCYGEYGDACLLRGFIQLELGDENAAGMWWEKAHRKNWPGAPIPERSLLVNSTSGKKLRDQHLGLIVRSLAASLSNDVTESETDAIVYENLQGAGRLNSGVIKIATKEIERAVPKELMRQAFLRMYQSPPGREIARKMVFRECDLLDFIVEPLINSILEILEVGAFRDEKMTVELRESVAVAMREIVDDLRNKSDQISDPELLSLFRAYSDANPGAEWDRVQAKYRPAQLPIIACVLGCRAESIGKFAEAKSFFQEATRKAEITPLWKNFAEARMKALTKP